MAYVYAITIDGTIRYVGKGSGDRIKVHIRRARAVIRGGPYGEKYRKHHLYAALAKAIERGQQVAEMKMADGLTEDEAYALEAQIIATTAELLNKAAGGRGGNSLTSAASWSDPETRAARIESIRRAAATLWLGRQGETSERARMGWVGQDDRRARQSARVKARWKDPAFRSDFMAKVVGVSKSTEHTQTPLARQKRRDSVRAAWASITEAERDARRAAMREGRRKAREARASADV